MTHHIIQFAIYALAATATVMLTSLLGMIINRYVLRRKPFGQSRTHKIAATASSRPLVPQKFFKEK